MKVHDLKYMQSLLLDSLHILLHSKHILGSTSTLITTWFHGSNVYFVSCLSKNKIKPISLWYILTASKITHCNGSDFYSQAEI